MKEVPSGVVELIIAVDLDPSSPEEPINVNDVKVSPKGEGGEEGSCPMCKRLIAAFAKIDPDVEALMDDKLSEAEMVKAIEKLADDAPEDAQEEADPFDRATKPKKPERPGREFDKKPGGFKRPEKAFGKEAPKPFGRPDVEDDDDDEEEE